MHVALTVMLSAVGLALAGASLHQDLGSLEAHSGARASVTALTGPMGATCRKLLVEYSDDMHLARTIGTPGMAGNPREAAIRATLAGRTYVRAGCPSGGLLVGLHYAWSQADTGVP